MHRRDFIKYLSLALASCSAGKVSSKEDLYDQPAYGNMRLIHICDTHAQLQPVYFREPSDNIGIYESVGKPPHLVGKHFLDYFGMKENSALAHALTFLNYEEEARRFGKMGGFAHIATLVKKFRAEAKNSLLTDAGDNWHGSATSLMTKGEDMVKASLLLGIDAMTGHWEFTLGQERVRELVDSLKGKIHFLAQNVVTADFEEPVFESHTVREYDGFKVAIIGEAFPFTPISNPRYMIPDWSFGVRDKNLKATVAKVRAEGAGVVVLLSHCGTQLDVSLAADIEGIDVILGGHTHDAIPRALEVKNPSNGKTLVINCGSNGKFVGLCDLDIKNNKLAGYKFNLVPVFSNMIKPDKEMAQLIEDVRAPYRSQLESIVGKTEQLLYRRGNFSGTMDQLILDALMQEKDAEIAFSPGFRWGTSVLSGENITYDDLMNNVGMTYPNSTLTEMTGKFIKEVLEDITDNLFHPDPLYRQGGDMVRVGGLEFSVNVLGETGKRISDMRLGGKPLDAAKTYKVAGWASVQENAGDIPIQDIVSSYLKSTGTVKNLKINRPKVLGVDNNPGMEG